MIDTLCMVIGTSAFLVILLKFNYKKCRIVETVII